MKKCWNLTNYKSGHLAEKIALFCLLCKGYWPVQMNYVVGRGTGAGEVDFIVKRGKTLVFVEVKKRGDELQAKTAIHLKNQSRIERTAQVFLSRNPRYASYAIRYDAFLFYPQKFPQHLKNAWRPFLFFLCFLLSGCQIWSGVINVGHSLGVIIADDQPLSQDAKDVEIYLKIRENLAAQEIKTLLDVQVTVFGGRVLLTGALQNLDLISKCVETCWQLEDVKYVYNYIRSNERSFMPSGQSLRNIDLTIQVTSLLGLSANSGIGAAVFVAIVSALFDKNIKPALGVIGSISIGGAVERALNFSDKVSMLSDNGAKTVIVPMDNLPEMSSLPSTILSANSGFLPSLITCSLITLFSCSKSSAGTLSIFVYNGLIAAACIATSLPTTATSAALASVLRPMITPRPMIP